MATTDKETKGARQNRLRKVLSGIDKHMGNITAMTIAQVVYPVVELKARIQKDIDSSDAADKARAAWRELVQTERSTHKEVNPLLRGIKTYVELTWGTTQEASGTLEDFGYAPRKPKAVKPVTKVTAAAKAKATRDARHTMGKKKKLGVKGTQPVSGATAAGGANPVATSTVTR